MRAPRMSFLLCLSLASACGPAGDFDGFAPDPDTIEAAAAPGGVDAAEWMQLLADRVEAERLSPPVAARLYAYAGVALYEAVAPGRSGYRSLSGQLQGMPVMPQAAPRTSYDWPCVTSGALSALTTALLPSSGTRSAVQTLRTRQIGARTSAGASAVLITRSVEFGERVGRAVRDWATSDGFASRSQSYSAPAGPSRWVPTGDDRAPALEPGWGALRPFALSSADSCAPPAPTPFSSSPGSAFYDEAAAVYHGGLPPSAGQADIARFWADLPGVSATPGGHWVSILNQLVQQRRLTLTNAAEAYALLGVALGDAFISCWRAKFRDHLLRPETYIQRHIDPAWRPLLKTPPFPEYTSGHSVASAASSEVLGALLGGVAFTDKTHERDGLGVRSFASPRAAAQEAAWSRLYGGIHYPMGITAGLDQGACVGRVALSRLRTRP